MSVQDVFLKHYQEQGNSLKVAIFNYKLDNKQFKIIKLKYESSYTCIIYRDGDQIHIYKKHILNFISSEYKLIQIYKCTG